jgi:hypothetical protein
VRRRFCLYHGHHHRRKSKPLQTFLRNNLGLPCSTVYAMVNDNDVWFEVATGTAFVRTEGQKDVSLGQVLNRGK